MKGVTFLGNLLTISELQMHKYQHNLLLTCAQNLNKIWKRKL